MTNRKTIVYADDTENIRELVGIYLKMHFPKYNREPHKSGLSLQKRLQEDTKDIALLFSDNTMPPGPRGVELTKEYSRNDFPIILASGDLPEKEALEAGASDYLSKPFDQQEFLDAVKPFLKD